MFVSTRSFILLMSFNRTIEELKWAKADKAEMEAQCFNRTIEELKYNISQSTGTVNPKF